MVPLKEIHVYDVKAGWIYHDIDNSDNIYRIISTDDDTCIFYELTKPEKHGEISISKMSRDELLVEIGNYDDCPEYLL